MFRIRSHRVAQSGRRLISSTASDFGLGASELSLVVKAGSRHEPAPGVAHLLKTFAFQDTKAKSGLRLQRESELLGGSLSATLGKEHLVLTGRFLREDLPYFVEALADTASKPLYRTYQFNEEVVPLAQLEAQKLRADPIYLATEGAYEVAFRRGLANPVLVSAETPLSLDQVVSFGEQVYTPENVALFGRNVNSADLEKFGGSDFAKLTSTGKLSSEASNLYSGEYRVKRGGEQGAVLAFPTTNTKGLDVLQRVLTGRNLKWSATYGLLTQLAADLNVKIDSFHEKFSDASLFYVTIRGASPAAVSKAVQSTADAIKKVAAGQLDESIATSAINSAKVAAAEEEGLLAGYFKLTEADATSAKDITAAAKQLVDGKRVLSVVGKTYEMPYVADLF